MNMQKLTKKEKLVLYALWHAGGTIQQHGRSFTAQWTAHLAWQMSSASIGRAVRSLAERGAVSYETHTIHQSDGVGRLKSARLTDRGYAWAEREQQVFQGFAELVQYRKYEKRPTLRKDIRNTIARDTNGDVQPEPRRAGGKVEDLLAYLVDHDGESHSASTLGAAAGVSNWLCRKAYHDGLVTCDPPLKKGGQPTSRPKWTITEKGLARLLDGPDPNQPGVGGHEPVPEPVASVPEPVASVPEPVDAGAVAAALLEQVVQYVQTAETDSALWAEAQETIASLTDRVSRLTDQVDTRNELIETVKAQRDQLAQQIDAMVDVNIGLEERLALAQSENAQKAAIKVAAQNATYLDKLADRIRGGR